IAFLIYIKCNHRCTCISIPDTPNQLKHNDVPLALFYLHTCISIPDTPNQLKHNDVPLALFYLHTNIRIHSSYK
ncbi:hypothetical protein DXA21_23000, partial [Parabacteroides distasonis]